jgi:hypothetical protein
LASPTSIDAAWTFDDKNTAQNGRFVIGALFQDAATSTAANTAWRDGVVPGPYSTSLSTYRSLHVTENSPTGSSVLVQPGHAIVTRTAQGVYLCPNSAPRVVALDAADATNPRIDLIVLQVLDTALGDASTDVQVKAVTGTPAGSPSPPAVPTGAIELARVAVAAAPTGNTIVNANITDRRRSTGLKGSVRPLLALDLATDDGVHGDLRDTAGLIERYNAATDKWEAIAKTNMGWGYVADTTVTTNGGSVTGSSAEYVGRSFSFAAQANRRYKVTWLAVVSHSANSYVTWRHRWTTGAGPITTSSTLISTVGDRLDQGGESYAVPLEAIFTGPSTAQTISVGFTVQTVSAINSSIVGNASNPNTVLIEDIGGV